MLGREDFLQEITAAVGAYPRDAELRLGYSRVLRGAELFDEARSMLQEALRQDDADPRLLGELAGVHQDAGNFEAALQCARQAQEQLPGDSGITDIAIDALVSLGRARQAMPLIDAARARNPLNQWYIAMEATAARLLGDPRYEKLYDYGNLVRSYAVAPPQGWSSIEAFHEALIPALEKRHQFSAAPLDQSLRLGTQTPRGLLGDPDPVIQAFLQMLVEPIAAYREVIGTDPDHPLTARNHGASVLTGCWSVRLKRGGHHVNHVHSEGWISSAYYVDVPPEVKDTKARSGWIKFGEPRFPVPGATAGHFVQPVAGRLVLFPSYMWHGTTPILGNDPRMTIAFDVITRPETAE
jgi:tetratricopeptide (TPR) repeat protein